MSGFTWVQYAPRDINYLAMDKEFWDAWRPNAASAHVLRLGDKWCAWAQRPSKFGHPCINHGGGTGFDFTTRAEAQTKAEQLAREADDAYVAETSAR